MTTQHPADDSDPARDDIFVYQCDAWADVLFRLLKFGAFFGLFFGMGVLGMLVDPDSYPGSNIWESLALSVVASVVLSSFFLAEVFWPRLRYPEIPHTPVSQVDREGVSLRIDDEGIYLGGRHPRRIDWPDVTEVALFVNVFMSDSEYHLNPPSKIYHGVEFRLKKSDPRPRERRSLTREWMPADTHQKIRAVVSRHAPAVRFT